VSVPWERRGVSGVTFAAVGGDKSGARREFSDRVKGKAADGAFLAPSRRVTRGGDRRVPALDDRTKGSPRNLGRRGGEGESSAGSQDAPRTKERLCVREMTLRRFARLHSSFHRLVVANATTSGGYGAGT